QESVVVLHRLFELEAASSELVELVRSLAEPCRRLSERGRAIHRPLRADGAVPPVTPLLHPVVDPALVDHPAERGIHTGSYIGACLRSGHGGPLRSLRQGTGALVIET